MTPLTSSQIEFIRLGENVLVPVRDFQLTSGTSGELTIVTSTWSRPVTGGLLGALRAFLDGTVEFPVTANGVLDLWRGWQEAENSRAALGGGSAANTEFLPPIEYPIPSVAEKLVQPVPEVPSLIPLPEVERRLKK